MSLTITNIKTITQDINLSRYYGNEKVPAVGSLQSPCVGTSACVIHSRPVIDWQKYEHNGYCDLNT